MAKTQRETMQDEVAEFLLHHKSKGGGFDLFVGDHEEAQIAAGIILNILRIPTSEEKVCGHVGCPWCPAYNAKEPGDG